MSELQAGFGRAEITPDNMGFPMMGYSARVGTSTGVHDPLWARALVLRQGDTAWALCVLDLIGVSAATVADIREQVSQRTQLAPGAVLVAVTHTHSGPNAADAGNWNDSFVTSVADAIVQAWEDLQLARIGSGAGFLYSHTINRRWFERPIDPGVGVLRVNDPAGNLLGLVSNFGLHGVVLGYDNLLISSDHFGYTRDRVEGALGGTCICTNGGAGNINPITDTVRRQMAERRSFTTMTKATYYGQGPDAVEIEDRKGGTFAEAAVIGHALAQEIIYVAQGLTTHLPERPPWSAQAWVNHLDEGEELIETQALGVGDFALVAQPGEVFAETALAVKEKLRQLGYSFPWLVSYANDWQAYMVPEDAWREGGYEVGSAAQKRHSPQLQSRLWAGIYKAISIVTEAE